MADPINSNLLSNTCGNPIGSNCVTWNGPDIPCLSICKGATITQVQYQMATLLCSLSASMDLSSIDLKCLCGTGELQCCPEGWNLVQLSTGEFACQNQVSGVISQKELIPCPSTPCPEKTLVNILQLIINKLCP